MKKIMGLLIILTLLVFTSCSNETKEKLVMIETTRISPNQSLKFNTNFDYDYYNVYINESPVNFQSSPGSFFIKNLEYGNKNLKLEFFNDDEELITQYSTTVFFDNEGPNITKNNIFIEKSVLNINFETNSDDYNYSELKIGDTLVASSVNTSFSKNINKDSGDINLSVILYDNTMNTTNFSTIINTNIDRPPKIISEEIKINLFSEYKLKFYDDWDKELNIFVANNEDDSYFYPYNLLESNLSTSTINAFDSSNNFDTKVLKISKDLNIPLSPNVNSRLISSDSGFFSWNPEGESTQYIIEVFENNFGWYPKYKTNSTFFEIKDENLSFVRKVSKNNTKGLPSPPIIKFTDTLKPYESGILDNIKQNSILNQINSPFIIASDILIEEGTTLFIESGTTLRFFADSRLIVRGNLFIMPGLVNSNLIGRGIIVMDGGNLIISDSDIENINISGKRGNLIFLENTKFSTDSRINLNNISRVQFYNVIKNQGSNNLENISGIYILNSEFSDLNIKNSYETMIYNSNINSFQQNFRTRTVIENSMVNDLYNQNFSYFNSINSIVENVNNINFSLYLEDDSVD